MSFSFQRPLEIASREALMGLQAELRQRWIPDRERLRRRCEISALRGSLSSDFEILKAFLRELGRPLAMRSAILEMTPAILREASASQCRGLDIFLDGRFQPSERLSDWCCEALVNFVGLVSRMARDELSLGGSQVMEFWKDVCLVPQTVMKDGRGNLLSHRADPLEWNQVFECLAPKDRLAGESLVRLDKSLESFWLQMLQVEAGLSSVWDLNDQQRFMLVVDQGPNIPRGSSIIARAQANKKAA